MVSKFMSNFKGISNAFKIQCEKRTLCDKVCLAAGRWFSPGTLVSSTK